MMAKSSAVTPAMLVKTAAALSLVTVVGVAVASVLVKDGVLKEMKSAIDEEDKPVFARDWSRELASRRSQGGSPGAYDALRIESDRDRELP